jgi:hypothetical protein
MDCPQQERILFWQKKGVNFEKWVKFVYGRSVTRFVYGLSVTRKSVHRLMVCSNNKFVQQIIPFWNLPVNIRFRRCHRQYIPKWNLLLRLFNFFPVQWPIQEMLYFGCSSCSKVLLWQTHKSRQYIPKWNLLSKLVSIFPVHRSPDRITTLFNRKFHFGIYHRISPCWSGSIGPLFVEPKKY